MLGDLQLPIIADQPVMGAALCIVYAAPASIEEFATPHGVMDCVLRQTWMRLPVMDEPLVVSVAMRTVPATPRHRLFT